MDVTLLDANGNRFTAKGNRDTGALLVEGLVEVSGAANVVNQELELAALNSIAEKTPALGQALAGASTPVVLTAEQLSTLTPPAAITGFSRETTLAEIDTKLSSQATATNQTTGNASLSSIDTKLSSQATATNQDALKATQYLSQNNVQTVSFDTNTLATALATNTTRVVLTATQDCWVKLGGTATVGGAGCIFIPAGVPYPPILTTAGTVINVIKDTTAGKLNIYESV
jgi:hypothetical protein